MSGELVTPKSRMLPWQRVALGVLIAVPVTAVGFGACAVKTAVQAENTLHANRFVCELVQRFVTQHHRWPDSWDELELVPGSDLCNGEYQWPEDAAAIRQRVAIDFQADPRKIAYEDPEEFSAIRPLGPNYGNPVFVSTLQQAIRESMPAARQRPD
jgi:hypothetical protein